MHSIQEDHRNDVMDGQGNEWTDGWSSPSHGEQKGWRKRVGRGWNRNPLKELTNGVKGSWLLCGPETPFIQFGDF